MLGYGLPYMINNLLLLLVPLCERTLLRTLGSADALGVYTAAAVFGMPALLLTGVLDSLWNPLMLQRCGERDRFGRIIHDVGLGVTHLLCLGVAACILLRRVAALLLGAAYRDAAAVAPALLLCAGLGAVALIYGSGINILRKTSYHVAAALLQLTVSVLFCCLLVPLHGAQGAAIAALLGSLAGRLLRMAVGLHLYGTGRREYGSLALLLFSVLAAVVAALHTSPAADLCVGGVLLCLALPSAVGQARVLLLRRRPAKEESV
jgi:O-antigen/teichoic acid export membrane protein